MVYTDQQHKIQTTILRKLTDKKTYLNAQSNHFKSLKDSISYSQALRIKIICSATSELNKNCDIITKRFKERRYPENLINKQVDKVKNMKRKKLLSTNKRTIQYCIPISSFLQMLLTLQKVFDNKPMKTYKRNKNLGELIGGHTL